MAIGSAFAQVATGSLSGTVLDSNGASVPGASVAVRNDATGVELKTVSSEGGLYVFATMPTGAYTLAVEKMGFKKAQRAGVEIRVATRQELDIRLEVGDVQQTVEVTGELPLLETTSAQRGNNISPELLNNLPLFTGGIRNPQAFVRFMPGVNSGAELSIAGSGGRASEVQIDGASLIIPESGGAVFNFPSAEMFGEFKLLTGTYDAEYGRFGGGVQIFVTKSGTNDFHATGFLFLRRDIWNANAWARNTAGLPRLKERFNEQGGAGGGPVFIPKVYDGRNRTFWYVTYSKDKRPVSITGTPVSTIPTVLMKQGNFSQLPAAQIVYDPATTSGTTRLPFAGNVIPQSRFSAISRGMVAAIPDATRPTITNNYDYVNTQVVDRTIWNLKFDHAFSANNRLAFLVTKENQLTGDNQVFAGALGQGLQQFQRPDNWRVNHDLVLKPTLLVHTTFGYSRTRQVWDNPNQKGGASRFGFPGITGDSDATPRICWPNCLAGGPGGGPDALWNWGVQDGKVGNGSQINITWHTSQGITWVKGKHEIKAGWEFRNLQTTSAPVDLAGTNGTYSFARAQTALPTALATTGHAFASFLLGAPDRAERVALPVLVGNIRYYYAAGYVQDNWKVTPRLTVSLGFRYDAPINWHDKDGNYSGVNLTRPNPAANNRAGALEFYGSGAGRTGQLRPYPRDWSNVGPRLSFAYRLFDKTVIRAGYGIFYQTLGNGGCGCRTGFANPIVIPSDGVNASLNWEGGIPAPAGFQPPPILNAGLNVLAGDVDYFSPNFGKAPRVHNWSFNIQHEIGKYLIDVAYVGNRGTRLASTLDLNQLPTDRLALGSLLSQRIDSPAVAAAGFTKPYESFPNSQPLAQALRPYPQYFGVIERNAGVGRTWYDSLQAKVERRFGDLQMLGAYTWSKSLALAHFRQIFSQTQVWPQDMYNVNDMKSFLPFDRPHVFNLLSSYKLPFGKGKKFMNTDNWFANLAFGDWNLSVTMQYRSGDLIQLTAPNTLGNGVIFSRLKKANVGGGSIRTGVGAGELDPNNPNVRWFNASAFAIPGQFQLGNAALYYDDFRQPNVFEENISLSKTMRFPISENRSIDVSYRADAFNAFNRQNFGGVNGVVGNANFGRPTGPQTGARIITMGVRATF